MRVDHDKFDALYRCMSKGAYTEPSTPRAQGQNVDSALGQTAAGAGGSANTDALKIRAAADLAAKARGAKTLLSKSSTG